MDYDECIRYLCAAVQALMSGEEVVDGELRLAAATLESHEGVAVQVDAESEPGTIVYRLVPYDG